LLTGFLDHVALVTDLDSLRSDRGGISVMTLHSAKGLEFKAVYVTGLEDGLLPHFNSQGAREDVEEERRLLYVGMTRARERLYLTTCRRRRIAGRYQDQLESPFLAELPEELLLVTQSPELFAERRNPEAQRIYSYFGQGSSGASPSLASPTFERSYGRPASGSPRGPSTPSAPSGYRERTVVPDPDAVPRRAVRRGSRVRHPTLGQGVVLELEGSDEDAKITVFFDKAGKRKLIAKFANLEML
ncbi:MAG TPA: 3'-5' exonuclease, partial [Thermoanaerobaculia bacterium]|nr:3'-5' exonuclease [Thermoanaerobaculia bacterium]